MEKSTKRDLILYSLILATITLVVSITFVMGKIEDAIYAKDGILVEAEIIAINSMLDTHGTETHIKTEPRSVTYQFRVNSETYTNQASYDLFHPPVKKGDIIQIEYIRDDPDESRPKFAP